MPEPVQSSWADEIEDNDSTVLPPPSEKIKGDIKTVTEFSFNEVPYRYRRWYGTVPVTI